MLDSLFRSWYGEIVCDIGRGEGPFRRLQNHLMGSIEAQKPPEKCWLSPRLYSELIHRECTVKVLAKEVEQSQVDASLCCGQW